jgi:hypothetical protein
MEFHYLLRMFNPWLQILGQILDRDKLTILLYPGIIYHGINVVKSKAA